MKISGDSDRLSETKEPGNPNVPLKGPCTDSLIDTLASGRGTEAQAVPEIYGVRLSCEASRQGLEGPLPLSFC